MDPIANLKEQLELAREIEAIFDTEQIADKGERLAELVLALDEWMRKGGFSPWVAYSGELRQRKLLIEMAAGIPSHPSKYADTHPDVIERTSFSTLIRESAAVKIVKDWWRSK